MLFQSVLISLLLALAPADAKKCSGGHRRHHHSSVASAVSKHHSSSHSSHSATGVNFAGSSAYASSYTGWSGSSKAKSTSTASSTKATSTQSSGSFSSSLSGLKKNGIYCGFLPDDGSGGGTSQTMSQINSAMGQTAATQGWYAQAQSGTLFDGSQLTSRKSQIVSAGGVFQPAVMPTGGWWGLTESNNQQAVAICKVMKEFLDEGLEVWLRFGHEVNYYQTDGTYQGDASDFKTAWGVVHKACQTYAPGVKMWFTPNIASESQYDEYYPSDPDTVDLIGIDYYPKDTSSLSFTGAMQSFHDKYTSSKTKFAIGEIGLGVSASISTRKAWLADITSSSTASAMPNYIAMSWFNYYKGYDFRIAAVDGDSIVKAYFED